MALSALKRKARHQAAGLVLVLACAIGAGWALKQRELGRSSLRLPIGELRSQAAEYARLREVSTRKHLPQRFTQVHAAHLAERADAARTELAGLRLPPRLQNTRREAGALATELSALLHREAGPESAATAFALASRLADIEARI
jgi:hypothetical protein